MHRDELKNMISRLHQEGRPAAVCFCSHVPAELFEAAGVGLIRVPYIEGAAEAASRLLPANVCPVVKNCADVCEEEALEDADLIIAETSCDGKRKLFELISRQERVYFFQPPQGTDRTYANPLIKSECLHLAKELRKRFGCRITDDSVRQAGEMINAERQSVRDLMAVQKETPPPVFGRQIFKTLEDNRRLTTSAGRAAANISARRAFISDRDGSPVPSSAARILITGCPLSGLYEKVIGAVEDNGGVVVCIENCEVLESAMRHFDTEAKDVYQSLADCYQMAACAIMSPNDRRFSLIRELVTDYRVDGILDIQLPVCHPFTVERDKMVRLSRELGVPYLSVQPDITDTDDGQITTRITAFLEMI